MIFSAGWKKFLKKDVGIWLMGVMWVTPPDRSPICSRILPPDKEEGATISAKI
jgi:hypothetical protein